MNPSKKSIPVAAALSMAAVFVVTGAFGQTAGEPWPREVEHSKGKIVVYQPQMDEYVGTTLKVRSAISVTLRGKEEPTFGAIWAEAKTNIDRELRSVRFSEIKITRVRFPGATPDQEKLMAAIIQDAAPKWNNDMDYDRFVAGIAVLQRRGQTLDKFKNDPPAILIEKQPALLLHYDGEPKALDIEGTKLKRIVNTPSVVLNDPVDGAWYLYGGAGWYQAKEPKGPWTPTPKPSADVAALVSQMEKKAADSAKAKGEVLPQEDERVLAAEAKKEDPKFDPAKPPKVIAVTGPAEIVVFEGEPSWTTLVGGDLLYADNTGSDVFMDVAAQRLYVLLSGRWYRAAGPAGPWQFVPPDKLPEAFKKIPEDSGKGAVLAHVGGTPQAEEALADAMVPQIAAVKRGTVELEVKYDGPPQFEPIPGTAIDYAKNTAARILRIGEKYYACDQAVWYVSSTPWGPWEVADSLPEEFQKIPPESPAYNLKYVTVYDSTPEEVYVGYTPEYLGCYPYYGTVVWGTGYWYTPWIGTYYYPSPWTYGFHAVYNPYAGWSFGFGVGYSWGWGSITIGWSNYGWYGYPPPYWGPAGFYPIYRPPYYPGGYPPHYPGRPGVSPYGGGRPSTLPARPGGGRPSTLPAQPGGRPSTLPAQPGGRPSTLPAQQPGGGRSANIYQRPENKDRITGSADRPGASTLPTRPSAGGDNVFVNEAGDVFRRNSNGTWDKRAGNSWQPAGGSGPGGGAGGARPGTTPSVPNVGAPSPGPSAPAPGTLPSNPGSGRWDVPDTMPSAPSSGLERDYSSRERGSTRAGGFQSSGGYHGGGAPRGGGGRRR